jgi:hypothetical protein
MLLKSHIKQAKRVLNLMLLIICVFILMPHVNATPVNTSKETDVLQSYDKEFGGPTTCKYSKYFSQKYVDNNGNTKYDYFVLNLQLYLYERHTSSINTDYIAPIRIDSNGNYVYYAYVVNPSYNGENDEYIHKWLTIGKAESGITKIAPTGFGDFDFVGGYKLNTGNTTSIKYFSNSQAFERSQSDWDTEDLFYAPSISRSYGPFDEYYTELRDRMNANLTYYVNNSFSPCPQNVAVSFGEKRVMAIPLDLILYNQKDKRIAVLAGNKDDDGFCVDKNKEHCYSDFRIYNKDVNASEAEPREYITTDKGVIDGVSEVLPLVQSFNSLSDYASVILVGDYLQQLKSYDIKVTNFANEGCGSSDVDVLKTEIILAIKNLENIIGEKKENHGSYKNRTGYDSYLRLSDIINFSSDSKDICDYFINKNNKEQLNELLARLATIRQTSYECGRSTLDDLVKVNEDIIAYYQTSKAYWEKSDESISSDFKKLEDAYNEISGVGLENLKKSVSDAKALCNTDQQAAVTAAHQVIDTYSVTLQTLVADLTDISDKWVEDNTTLGGIGNPQPIECKDFGEGNIAKVFSYLSIIGTILLIVFGVIDFSKASLSGDDDALKKAGKNFSKRLIAAVLLLILPIIVNFIMNIASDILDIDPVECFTENE